MEGPKLGTPSTFQYKQTYLIVEKKRVDLNIIHFNAFLLVASIVAYTFGSEWFPMAWPMLISYGTEKHATSLYAQLEIIMESSLRV